MQKGDDMKNKKAMEMSMNTVIIAVILLIVMIVLIMIFTGKMGSLRKSMNKTESEYSAEKCEVPGTGRVCVISEDACENRGGFVYQKPAGGKWGDCMWGQECCSN